MTEWDKEKNLTWFFTINIALLFISGCWMVGSLMISVWGDGSDLHRLLSILLFSSTTLANISFLVSMLFSILGIIQITTTEKARQATAYAFICGIIFLVLALILFGLILVLTTSSRLVDRGLD
jgi:hypothetical protein